MQVLYERCAAVISEIGADVREYFPDAAHLASWAGICPGNHESAGKRRSGRRRHGNQHLQPVLVECAWSAVRHEGYLKALCHRHVMKWGGYRSPTASARVRSGILTRILPLARSASTAGRRSPSMRASIIARPDLVAMLEATGPVLMPASWSTLPSRCSSEVRDWTTLVRYRMTSRAALPASQPRQG